LELLSKRFQLQYHEYLFLELHFLGIAGMPRRIPDYPDAFAGWNAIASYGSYLSVLSVFFFFYVVYKTLTSEERCPRSEEHTSELQSQRNQ
jgi:heme/copper-type cytochrome/quinol oxidase subunit 1